MKCTNCNAELGPGARFCGECGQPVSTAAEPPPRIERAVPPPTVRCANCGAELGPGERFCGECGQPVPAPVEPPPIRLRCASCGAELAPGERFCGECGQPVAAAAEPPPRPAVRPTAPPPRPTARPMAPPPRPTDLPERGAQPAPVQPRAPSRPRFGCCGTGCLAVLSVLVVLVILGAALYFRVPQQLGLLPSPQRLLSEAPNREAAAALKEELAEAGIDTRGMDIYVLPFRDKPGSIAYAVLDASNGFQFKPESRDPVVDYFKQMANSAAADTYGIQRIAIEYRSTTGTTLLNLTASRDTIAGYSNGTLSREQFLKGIDGQANWSAFFQEVLK